MIRSPLIVIAWSLWLRHRVGFIVSATVFALPVISYPLLVEITPSGAMALTTAAPLVAIFAFVLNSLLWVEHAGSLTSRYPRFMLTFPVKTWSLTFWPMLLVTVCSGFLWVAAALLIYRPAGYQTPILLPALGLAGMMAWAQVLAWMPIQVFWIREFTTIFLAILLGCLGALPIWLTVSGTGSASLAVLVLLIYIAFAFLVAWAAVASDRHGVAWRFWPAQWTSAKFAGARSTARPMRPFRSPFAAQLSYEWACHGLMLNLFVAVILFIIWGVLLLRQGHGTPEWLALIFVLLPIVLTATIAGSGTALGRLRPFWDHKRSLVRGDTFIATRPISSAEMVAAKFRMAAWSVVINWTFAVTGTIVWLFTSDNLDVAAILVRRFFGLYPGGRGVAIIVLTCILLPALSWRLLTGNVVPGLSGRRWVADGAVFLYVAFLTAIGGCGYWLANSGPEQIARMYAAIPFIIVGIALVKAGLAAAGFQAALKRGLMSGRNIAGVLCLWIALTACGIALSVLLGSSPSVPISLPVLASSVATLVPLARFPLATLALDWNRHR